MATKHKKSDEQVVRVVRARLIGDSPISFCVRCDHLQRKNEDPAEFDERIWREKAHCDKDGLAFIPSVMIHKMMGWTASYLGLKVKGNEGFKRHFDAGILVRQNVSLEDPKGNRIHKDDFIEFGGWMSADGRPGSGGKRVWRRYPQINDWAGDVEIWVFDEIIPKDIFEQVLRQSGVYSGIGRWRPANGGLNGRFYVKDLVWEEMTR